MSHLLCSESEITIHRILFCQFCWCKEKTENGIYVTSHLDGTILNNQMMSHQSIETWLSDVSTVYCMQTCAAFIFSFLCTTTELPKQRMV